MDTFTVRIMKTKRWETSFPLKAENKDNAKKLALELIEGNHTEEKSGTDRYGFTYVDAENEVYSIWSSTEEVIAPTEL